MGRTPDLTTAQLAVIASSCLVITFINPVSGIKCWECNSAYDKRCADPFQNITTELVDCDQRGSEMTHLPLKADNTSYTKANICRKTIQTVNENTRVIRACGWIPNDEQFKDRECYTKSGTNQVMVFHCVCYSDKCNASPSFTASTILVLVLSAVAFLRFKSF